MAAVHDAPSRTHFLILNLCRHLALPVASLLGLAPTPAALAQAVPSQTSPPIKLSSLSLVGIPQHNETLGVPFTELGRRGGPLKLLDPSTLTPAAFEGPINRLLRKR
jgi:hypothetical protein